ncbi:MAG: TolC family protein [Spirochaetota bacterium]|nr:TolC family protein [Spirochaetota bacterium]
MLSTIVYASEKEITLEDYIKLVLKSNPEIEAAKTDIQFMEGYLDEAEGAVYPRFTFLGLTGPTPEIKGDAHNSDINWNKWGPFFHGQIDMQLPLYTFGRIPHGREAAINGMNYANAKVNEVKGEIILRYKLIYYGHLLAYSVYKNIVLFAEEKLKTALEKAEEEYDAGSGKVSKADLGRLKVGLAELLKRKTEAEKYLDLTKTTLARFIGYKNPDDFKIALKEIEPENVEIKPLDYYVKRAFKNNPQWNQLNYGIKSRRSLVKLEESSKYPILFLAGRVSGSYSPVVQDQKTYFANDPFNDLSGAIAIGLLWQFNFSISGRVKRADAEYKKLLKIKKFAQDGIYLLIKKTYLEIIEAKKNIEIYHNGYRAALSWFAFSFLAFESGTGGAKDAVEGLVAMLLNHYNYYENIFKFNIALAQMSQLVGEEITNLKY